jgi:transposase
VHRYLSPELDINVQNKGSRPAKTSKRYERALVSKIESGFLTNAVEVSSYLKENTDTKISAKTVRRVLEKSGLKTMQSRKNCVSRVSTRKIVSGLHGHIKIMILGTAKP